MKIKVISPKKIRDARGARTRLQIVENSGHRFTETQLLGWEKGLYKPSDLNRFHLVKALGVTEDAILVEVGIDELEKAA